MFIFLLLVLFMVPKKVHCFFEQSGTFKNEFINLGIPALDYDIEDNFSQTDFKLDLFREILFAFSGSPSVFDSFSSDDLIFAFFPCTFFESQQAAYYSFDHFNLSGLSLSDQIRIVLDRSNSRQVYYSYLLKLVYVCDVLSLNLIIENPFTATSYLSSCRNFPKPDIVHNDRSLFGDFYKKPTAYWFFGFKPLNVLHFEQSNVRYRIDYKSGFDRSLISSVYARNFILNHILGTYRVGSQLDLF